MADKHDRGRITARRQYAAHWLWMGRKISNISRAELARVKRHAPKRSYNSIKYSNPISAATCSRAPNKASVSIMAKRCTGVTKFVKRDSAIHKDTYKYVYHLNSCHTNALRWA